MRSRDLLRALAKSLTVPIREGALNDDIQEAYREAFDYLEGIDRSAEGGNRV